MMHHLHLAVVIVRRRVDLGNRLGLFGEMPANHMVGVRDVSEGLHCKVRNQVGPTYVRLMDIVLIVR